MHFHSVLAVELHCLEIGLDVVLCQTGSTAYFRNGCMHRGAFPKPRLLKNIFGMFGLGAFVTRMTST